jgi:hypothetical protein
LSACLSVCQPILRLYSPLQLIPETNAYTNGAFDVFIDRNKQATQTGSQRTMERWKTNIPKTSDIVEKLSE